MSEKEKAKEKNAFSRVSFVHVDDMARATRKATTNSILPY